jgi:chorismate mutase-like protein
VATNRKLDIEDWRKRIDAIDNQLLALLNERANCSIEVGWIKRARNLEIYVPSREIEILQRVTGSNNGPLTEAAIRRLFERIIDESRSIERVVCSHAGEEKPVAADKRVTKAKVRSGSRKAASGSRRGRKK